MKICLVPRPTLPVFNVTTLKAGREGLGVALKAGREGLGVILKAGREGLGTRLGENLNITEQQNNVETTGVLDARDINGEVHA